MSQSEHLGLDGSDRGDGSHGSFSSFRVLVPGLAYWTVVDGGYEPAEPVNAFLRDLRLAGARAESTTQAYATDLAIYLNWCASRGRSFEQGLDEIGRFIGWLKTTAIERPGRGFGKPRSAARINRILVSLREAAKHAAGAGAIDQRCLSRLYRLSPGASHDVVELARARAIHRLPEPRRRELKRVTEADWEALISASTSWRDRFLLIVLWMIGGRIGEILGLRREDIHFAPSSTALGCSIEGPHIHIERREDNPNRAFTKRSPRAVPAHHSVVSAYDLYCEEREACRAAAESDFLFVNLFHAPHGEPMKPDTVNDLLARLSRRAGLERRITAHMFRHAVGTRLAEAEVALDVISDLLGHASTRSTEVYLDVDDRRRREAVERLARREAS